MSKRARRTIRARPRPADPRELSTAERGRLGEQLAAAWLESRGFRCIARNLRTRHGEIDLLMRRRRVYVAVEVKTRTNHPAPEQSVDDQAVARLRHALHRIAASLAPPARGLRVDVVAVRLRGLDLPEIRHFPGDAFDL